LQALLMCEAIEIKVIIVWCLYAKTLLDY